MNVSCPNVKYGGIAFGSSATDTGKVTAAVRAKFKRALVVKLSPNVVVAVDSEDGNTARAVRQLGMKFERIDCRTLDDIPRAIRQLGHLLNREKPAAELAWKIETELSALRREPKPAKPVRVFVEVWGDPLMTAGKKAFLTELIALAGGVV